MKKLLIFSASPKKLLIFSASPIYTICVPRIKNLSETYWSETSSESCTHANPVHEVREKIKEVLNLEEAIVFSDYPIHYSCSSNYKKKEVTFGDNEEENNKILREAANDEGALNALGENVRAGLVATNIVTFLQKRDIKTSQGKKLKNLHPII